MHQLSKKIATLLFYAFVFFIPFRVDSLVYEDPLFLTGFYNSYTSFFIYLTDLLLLSSLFFFSVSYFFSKKNIVFQKSYFYAIFTSLLLIIYFLITSSFPLNTFFYLVRVFQIVAVVLVFLCKGIDLKKVMLIVVFSLLIQSIIGISQFLMNGSIGLNFLGESLISPEIKNVAKINFLSFSNIRAYGLFPHPNLFAFFLGLSIVFLVFLYDHFKTSRFLYYLIMIILIVGLILTFSRSMILAVTLSIGFYLLNHRWSYRKLSYCVIVTLFVATAIFLYSKYFLIDLTSLSERFNQFKISISIIFNNIFGVGLGNFTVSMQEFANDKLLPWQIQPVHNLILLIFAEIGVVAVFLVLPCLIYFWKCIKVQSTLYKKLSISICILLLFASLFDHYLMTLYQGQMAFSIAIAGILSGR